MTIPLSPAHHLHVRGGKKGEWDLPHNRRSGFKNLYKNHRYGMSCRAPQMVPLSVNIDFKLHDIDTVRWYSSHPFFDGLCVTKGSDVVFEHYASDCHADDIHSIQSISKTLVHLIAGKLHEQGKLDTSLPVNHFIKHIGSGYAYASVQQVMDMAVANEYSEDYYDATAMLNQLEDAHGWRIDSSIPHRTMREFFPTIHNGGVSAVPGEHHYKTANTDIVAWICEVCCGIDIRSLVLDIVDAFAPEHSIFVSTDRSGVPFLGGGLHMTLRDLCRYGRLLGRGGQGYTGKHVGSTSFTQQTMHSRVDGTQSHLGVSYHNFLETNGRWIGHLGYGGQLLMVYPEHDIVIACFSSLLDDGGLDPAFSQRQVAMAEHIADYLIKKPSQKSSYAL